MRVTHLRQEDVIDESVTDASQDVPYNEIIEILPEWDQVMENAEEVSKEIGHHLFDLNPSCKNLFPTLANVAFENLSQNEDVLLHSKAVLNGIHTAFLSLSGKYEEGNDTLLCISETHVRRGITCCMMQELKTAVLNACFDVLHLPRDRRKVWNKGNLRTVQRIGLNVTEKLISKTKTENHFKNLFHVKKPTRRSSLAEVREIKGVVKNSPVGRRSQITSPITLIRKQSASTTVSPTLSDRRPSRAFLHPDHARLMVKRSSLLTPPSDRFSQSFEDSRSVQNGLQFSPLSSSAASSITSISNAPVLDSQCSDPLQNYESRKSSTATNKYSILDVHDLEYSLIKAAARGSIGPYSLSQSLQKLTFTQSLAFPELARGASGKGHASRNNTRNKPNPLDSGVNAFAKVATALLLVLISVLVFGVLYTFIRT